MDNWTAKVAAGSAASRVDQKALDNIRALQRPGRPNILRRVIVCYLDTTPDLLDNLREAIDGCDAEAMRIAAHNLKSSSANLGATALAALAQELETNGRQQIMSGAADLMARVEKEYALVESELVTGYLSSACA